MSDENDDYQCRCAACGKARPKSLKRFTAWTRCGVSDGAGGLTTVLTCSRACRDIAGVSDIDVSDKWGSMMRGDRFLK